MEVVLISIDSSPSGGLLIMQEVLKEAGHTCKLVQASLHRYDETSLKNLAKQIAEAAEHVKLIGISTMTNGFISCKALVKQLRRASKAKIILGGIHPTVKPVEALEIADYICVGEGEYPLLELVNKLEKGEQTDNINNIYTKKEGLIVKNPIRPLERNIDKFPVPKFELKYFYVYYGETLYCLADNHELIYSVYSSCYFILTARGCPYVCTYCLNSALIKIDKDYRVIRRRCDDHVMKELINFKKAYKKKIIYGFVDDDFCARSEKDMENFLELYSDKIKQPFFVASTPHSMTERKLNILIAAGLMRLEIGIQSISDYVNKNIYHRAARKKDLSKAASYVNTYKDKIQLTYDILLDNPWEKDDTKIETLRYLYDFPRKVIINLYSLTIYPGTELYDKAIKEGIIKDEIKEIYKKNFICDIKNDPINTLFVLYFVCRFPKSVIELLLRLRKIRLFNFFLGKITIPLLLLRKSFIRFCHVCAVAMKALRERDQEKIIYFLKIFYRSSISRVIGHK